FFSLPSDEGESRFAVMDYIEGEDLGSKLQHSGGPLPREKVIDWIAQVCDALVYLHAQQPPIIHRDIKPANIRITPQGRAILVDFGIAKEYQPGLRTVIGARAVTLGYSPPEQYGIGSTEARSDIYALGATAYHLLSGQMPPSAADPFSGVEVLIPPLERVAPTIPRLLSAAIEKAMQPKLQERFANAAEFKAALLASLPATRHSALVSRPPSRAAASLQAPIPPTVIVANLAARWANVQPQPLYVLEGHDGSVQALAFSPDGETLASASVDKSVRLWRLSDGLLAGQLEGHQRSLNGLAFSPDGALLASTASDRTLRLWLPATGELLLTLETPAGLPASPAFTPDGRTLACVVANQAVHFWRVTGVSSGREPNVMPPLDLGQNGVTNLAFSPDGALLACACWRDKSVRLYRLQGSVLLHSLQGHSADLTSLAFSPDGESLASGAWDNSARLWRVADGSLTRALQGHSSGVLGVAFSPDGELLACACADHSLRIWRLSDGARLVKLTGHSNWVTSAAFSPDDLLLASGSRDGSLRVWSIK
ncbi:MAG: serine/threonine protein kinase, partial [Anaerolineales bacterium]|nr:serine/threonine protein kinase [Anaerolineales bacterium]